MKINFEFDSIEEMMEFAEKLGSKETTDNPREAVVSAKQEMPVEEKDKPVKQDEPKIVPESVKQEAPAAEEPVKDEPKKYTLVEVREKLSELQKAGKRDKVKELLNSFGASKLPEVPEDKYAELMEKAGEL